MYKDSCDAKPPHKSRVELSRVLHIVLCSYLGFKAKCLCGETGIRGADGGQVRPRQVVRQVIKVIIVGNDAWGDRRSAG